MIRYSLRCGRAHSFEGWFANSADFDEQKAGGLLTCPVCDGKDVDKAMMAPNIAPSRRVEPVPPAQGEIRQNHLSQLNPAQRELLRRMAELRRKVLAETEHVGDRFPEEARKIHYGEAEARAIHGSANLEEAMRLLEEGIEVIALPELPDDKN